MNTTQLMARAELVLGRVTIQPASTHSYVQAKHCYPPHIGYKELWSGSVWLDPPRSPRSGIPWDCILWSVLMNHRKQGAIQQAIFVKRGSMVTLDIEKPPHFLACYTFPSAPTRYLIPSYREEVQLIYVPGLTNNSKGFKKAFNDFGDLVEPADTTI